MDIYHLDSGPVRPIPLRLKSTLLCTLVCVGDELILIDTGLGRVDLTTPSKRMQLFTALMRCERKVERTVAQQIVALGYEPAAVKHVFLTHLHLDHSGGIPDLPDASVHVMQAEYKEAMHPRGIRRLFYEPMHWAHGPRWRIHEKARAGTWFGFDAIRIKEIKSAEVLMIPLTGHSPGHAGVAVRTENGWVLHCGDALPFGGLESDAPPWISALVLGPHEDRIHRLAQEHGDEVDIVSAHLPVGDSRLV
jgi:glyoxylase-like metal-dependent hydrolase (beta-lactamase superfamily II)